jgi:ribonucleoside-triphosphate reductase (thioredoxin)
LHYFEQPRRALLQNFSDYQKLIAYSRYARWNDDEQRREEWPETAKRYTDFWLEKEMITEAEAKKLTKAIVDLEVMPSMRALWTAGPALERDPSAGFNCTYVAVDHPRAFDEVFFLLMCGAGAGFSVERQYIAKLPEVPDDIVKCDTTIIVADSKTGWASALRQLMSLLWSGHLPDYDTSRVRAAGERLKTFGGRASGPGPLCDLLDFVIHTFKGAAGRRLTSIECHDLMCKIGEAVVVGGVRRSAEISLSNVSDDRMRNAKSGQWWDHNPQRALANNSAVYTDKPDFQVFQTEMASLYASFSGERGIFNREAIQKKIAKHGRRDPDQEFGCNPCAEIALPSGNGGGSACNLSEVVIRPDDTLASLKKKVEIAAIFGTLQSTLTNWRYVRKGWIENLERERLLGISFTGICDHEVMSGFDQKGKTRRWLLELRDHAEKVNEEWAERLGINPSHSVSCLKPSGTVSQLVDASSGIHPRYSKYYIRRIRQSTNDPMTQFLIDQGVPHEPCAMSPASTVVFEFYVAAPEHSITTENMSTIQQLEIAKLYGEAWATHMVSCTAYYTDDTWFEACQWIWKNWDDVAGMSFLPHDGGRYVQAPYEQVEKAEYTQLSMCTDPIDWSKLPEYERGDTTEGAKEAACVGDKCELV